MNKLTANSAIFNNVLYSGLATRLATPVPNLIAQFTSNSTTYVQVNAQNINPNGSADYVVTADVGTDSDFYIDMGILGSQYNNLTPENSLGTAGQPLDGYLYVQGSTINQTGGNLVIGTTSTISFIETRFIAGGSNTENIIMKINPVGVNINGDLYVSGDITGPTITDVTNLAQGAFDAANAIVIPSLGNYTFDGDTITNNITDSITLQTGRDSWIFGTDGELTLPSGGHIGSTKGGTMLDAGNGYDTSLTTFYANGNYAACVTGYAADGRLIITTYSDGGINPSKQWTFDTDGNLTVPGNIIPYANNEYSLGSVDFQWKSLYVSNNTIYIENIPLSLKSNGNTSILTIGSGANTTNIASENYVQSFQNIDGGSSTAIYSYELINLDGGGA